MSDKVCIGDYIKMYGFAKHGLAIIQCTTNLLGHMPGYVETEEPNGYLKVKTTDGREFLIHRRQCRRMGHALSLKLRREREQHSKDTRNNQPRDIAS